MDETDQMISDCEKRDDKLSEWEQSFIQSIREQFDRTGFLSEKQSAILDRIWEKVT